MLSFIFTILFKKYLFDISKIPFFQHSFYTF